MADAGHAYSRNARSYWLALRKDLEWLTLQQMGPSLQGCDDDSGRHRSSGPPQRDHRTERVELSRGNGENEDGAPTLSIKENPEFEFLTGNSNCR